MPASLPIPAERLALLAHLVDAAFTALADADDLADDLGLIPTRDHLRRALGMTGAAQAVVDVLGPLRQYTDAPAEPAPVPLCASPGCGHLPNVHARTQAGAPSYCDVVHCWCRAFKPLSPLASLVTELDPLLGTGR